MEYPGRGPRAGAFLPGVGVEGVERSFASWCKLMENRYRETPPDPVQTARRCLTIWLCRFLPGWRCARGKSAQVLKPCSLADAAGFLGTLAGLVNQGGVNQVFA